jgi:hypothetical protein
VTDLIYGPQTPAVQALISRASRLTPDETTRLAAAWNAVATPQNAAWIAMSATRAAAWNAVATPQNAAWIAMSAAVATDWNAAGTATWSTAASAAQAVVDAALALAVRGLIPDVDYLILTGPWARVVGRVHPDDPDRQVTLDA